MSIDPKWDPTGATTPVGGRYRPVPRRRKIPRSVWLGVPIAVVVVVGVAIALAWQGGYLGGPVNVSGVSVGYSGELMNGSAVTQVFSTTTGATIIDNVTANDSAPPPTSDVNYTEVCIVGATVAPATFGVVGLTPQHLCLAGGNQSFVFLTLSVPSRPYSGAIVVTIQDVQYVITN